MCALSCFDSPKARSPKELHSPKESQNSRPASWLCRAQELFRRAHESNRREACMHGAHRSVGDTTSTTISAASLIWWIGGATAFLALELKLLLAERQRLEISLQSYYFSRTATPSRSTRNLVTFGKGIFPIRKKYSVVPRVWMVCNLPL